MRVNEGETRIVSMSDVRTPSSRIPALNCVPGEVSVATLGDWLCRTGHRGRGSVASLRIQGRVVGLERRGWRRAQNGDPKKGCSKGRAN